MARDSIQYRFKCRGSAQGWQKLPSELIKVHSDTVTFTCSFAALHTQEDPSNGLSVMCLASWHSLNCNYGTKSAPCFTPANWPRHSIIALSCGQAPLNWKLFFFLFFSPPPHWLCLDLPLCTLDCVLIGLVFVLLQIWPHVGDEIRAKVASVSFDVRSRARGSVNEICW